MKRIMHDNISDLTRTEQLDTYQFLSFSLCFVLFMFDNPGNCVRLMSSKKAVVILMTASPYKRVLK